MWDLVRFVLMYTFYYVFFIIFYYVYLEILGFKIYIENCVKSKWKEQKETKGLYIIHIRKANIIFNQKVNIIYIWFSFYFGKFFWEGKTLL